MAGGRHRHNPAASRRSSGRAARQFPRAARVNESLREVLADALERLTDTDERLGLLTITGVECDPDLRHARVLFSSLDDEMLTVLSGTRVRLQTAISQQVRLKRTPQLRFEADPAVAAGNRIEDILRHLPHPPAAPAEPAELAREDEEGS
jgi:ribosome-binding factor A